MFERDYGVIFILINVMTDLYYNIIYIMENLIMLSNFI